MATFVGDPFVDSPERLTEYFRDDAALRYCALTADNALEYFFLSPFYQVDCINERVRTGEVSREGAQYLTGIEYVLVPTGAAPRLFVVERRLRRSTTDVAVLSVYYILDGSIFQCPDASTLLSSRVERCAHHVNAAMQHVGTLRKLLAQHEAAEKSALDTVTPVSASATTAVATAVTQQRGAFVPADTLRAFV